jgi:hypothetical protein
MDYNGSDGLTKTLVLCNRLTFLKIGPGLPEVGGGRYVHPPGEFVGYAPDSVLAPQP